MRKMEPLKFGIIGCSRIAKRSVIPAIQKSEFAELEIIGSRSTDKAKEFANEFNCEKFGTYEDVISDNSVDVVYISTPISTHREWSIKASEAGKHVYVEKSSAANLSSAREMVESAKENNVRLMEGFMFRFHPQHQKVKELINDGKIGEIKSFNGVFGFPAFPEGDIRYASSTRGGGFLKDSGCYPICASRMIFGEEPAGVFFNRKTLPKTGLDVEGQAILFYKNPTVEATEIVKASITDTLVTKSIRIFSSGSGEPRADLKDTIFTASSGSQEQDDGIKEIAKPNKDIDIFVNKYKYKTGLYGGMPAVVKKRGGRPIFASKEDPPYTIKVPGGGLTAKMQGGTVTIPEHTKTVKKVDGEGKTYNEEITVPKFETKIQQIINDTTLAVVDPPSIKDPTLKINHLVCLLKM